MSRQYIITDGERYIMKNLKGQYVPVPTDLMADTYTKDEAEKVLNKHVHKSLRKLFKVERLNMEDTTLIKPMTNGALTQRVNVVEDTNIVKWMNKVEHTLNGLREEALARKADLVSELSMLDLELSDLDHYLLGSKLNAVQGWKLSSMRQCRLEKRACVKNELRVVNAIISQNTMDDMKKDIEKVVHSMNERVYSPRVLTELFNI